MRKWILIVLLCCASRAFAQDDWYLGKPIADFQFLGLESVSEAELRPVVRPYIGQDFS
jgi:hypothetical protein